MAYQCLDCSYKSKNKFPNGKCPACDSYNIKKPTRKKTGKTIEDEDNERKNIAQIITLVLFWSVLIWGIWDRYIK